MLEIPSFEDQFCHASTSPTRLGMRRTGEPPTCPQCGARGSNTGKNTPRSSDVQKKGSSTRLPCSLRRSSGNIDVPHSTRVSIMFEPEAPASRVQRPRCAVPAACYSGWWVRTSCKKQGQMIVCTQSCLCLGWSSCGYYVRKHDCYVFTCQTYLESVTAETECAKKKSTLLGTTRKDLESQRSRLPALPPYCPLCSVSAIIACGVGHSTEPSLSFISRLRDSNIFLENHLKCSVICLYDSSLPGRLCRGDLRFNGVQLQGIQENVVQIFTSWIKNHLFRITCPTLPTFSVGFPQIQCGRSRPERYDHLKQSTVTHNVQTFQRFCETFPVR